MDADLCQQTIGRTHCTISLLSDHFIWMESLLVWIIVSSPFCSVLLILKVQFYKNRRFDLVGILVGVYKWWITMSGHVHCCGHRNIFFKAGII